MRLLVWWLTGAAALLPSLLQAAPSAVDQLREMVGQTGGLSAEFEQRLIDERGETVQASSGSVEILRPGRFRWDYRKPYEQRIIADGKRLWVYDTDLEQVTVRPMDAALGSTPSSLLSGGADLDTAFDYQELPPADGRQRVELRPRAEDRAFERIEIAFDGGGIAAMELVNAFGQTTRFRFSRVERKAPLIERFQFEPPPGVDVIGQP